MTDQAAELNGRQFWDLFFAGTTDRVRRDPIGMHGLMPPAPSARNPSFLDKLGPWQPFVAPRQALAAYDYAADPRFARLAQRPTSIDAALQACIDGSYPWRQRPPVTSAELRRICAHIAAVGTGHLGGKAELALSSSQPEGASAAAVLIWLLGEMRDLAAVPVIVTAIRKSAGEGIEAQLLGDRVFGAALTAFFQCNDKRYLRDLAAVLANCRDANRIHVRNLLIAMLSNARAAGEPAIPELMPEQARNPVFWKSVPDDLTAGYWLERLPSPTTSFEDWVAFDVEAMHWELRWLAALRLPPRHRLLRTLAHDEVAPVAHLASMRD